jgi:ABC-type glutathione transport system ATPase component
MTRHRDWDRVALPMTSVDSSGGHVLEVRALSVTYGDEFSKISAASDLAFSIDRGETLGVLGESGSGKSTLAMALIRCLPSTAQIVGNIIYEGRDLTFANEREMRKIRGARIALIFQDPVLALNPVINVGTQVLEVLRAHRDFRQREARLMVLDTLASLGFENVERIYRSFPHQLSGGQCQRIAIAQALICRPDLIIADEPTASLDAETALEIVKLLRRINHESSIAFLLISHDPAIVRGLADRIMVMRDGKIVEQGTADKVLNHPSHTYTKLLVAAERGIVMDEPSQLPTALRCSQA